MYKLSDTVIGLTLVAVLAAYMFINQAHSTPKEAVLGEISVIMNDLESELGKAETRSGEIPRGTDFHALLKNGTNTALMGHPGEPWLMPDVREDKGQTRLGGCPTDNQHWILLRTDKTALTQIPQTWLRNAEKICLDRNGAEGPNLEGYDVIWLSFSRAGSPHITLIPAQTGSIPLVE